MPRSLQIFLARKSLISVCLGTPIFCSGLDCATKNDGGLPEAVRNRENEGAAGIHPVLYGNLLFLIVPSGCGDGLLPVEFQRFLQSDFQAFEQLIPRRFLTIDAWDLFDPTNPPIAVLLDHCGVCVVLVCFQPLPPFLRMQGDGAPLLPVPVRNCRDTQPEKRRVLHGAERVVVTVASGKNHHSEFHRRGCSISAGRCQYSTARKWFDGLVYSKAITPHFTVPAT